MILDDIVRDKKADLQRVKAAVPLADLQQRALFRMPRRPFRAALEARHRAIIAEVKKASPSKGVMRADFDPVRIAVNYAQNGAAAISVLTEERYFQGHLDYLVAIRAAVSVPLLRKDFLVDPYQLYEARAFGADAVLLIVAILPDTLLQELLWLAEELNLCPLVEVHDRDELDRAVRSGAGLLGINNRDLRTFRTSLTTTEDLLPVVPPNALVVAESGIEVPADMERLERLGVGAFLIGEAFMRAPDPGARLAEFLGAR
ncbi:MAG TPA: indole-3-glycerol phosphate synthase TrpC [Candidatus Margulisiibacteriota bacterium]|nr:indole-3-glycerol phosphate synthase TrpC [Candidatus Margulisiibacteriota bacterium]